MISSSDTRKGIGFALVAAILFGISTPIAKSLIGQLSPVLLASLLYLGSAAGLGLIRVISHTLKHDSREAPLRRGDLPWLAGAILTGGVAGPVFLMLGLSRVTGSSASLLLNMESVLTIGIAWTIFREHFDRRIALGVVFILAGAVLLSYEGRVETVSFSGVILVVSACLSWAIDNNLTRKISAGDPIQIALIKGLLGGLVNLVIAFGSGVELPGFVTISVTAVVGFLGYGISLVLFVLALRYIGTARTGVYFSTAPFIGTIVAIPLLGEKVTPFLAVAGILMGIGVWLHLTEKHSHEHNHKEMIHEHSHIHEEHHQHEHDIAFDPDVPHSHIHRHLPLLHTHPHYPDLHHRHDHE